MNETLIRKSVRYDIALMLREAAGRGWPKAVLIEQAQQIARDSGEQAPRSATFYRFLASGDKVSQYTVALLASALGHPIEHYVVAPAKRRRAA